MLMLINGLCLCEMLGKPAKGKVQIIGSLIPAVGVLGAFFWHDAKMWLAVPTSVFCATLLRPKLQGDKSDYHGQREDQ